MEIPPSQDPAPAPGGPPRPGWHWLLLLSPAVSTLTISLFAKVTSLEPLVLLSLVVHPALSLVLGFWSVSRLPASGWRVVLAILVGIALAILNGIIAFAGCTTGIFNR